MKLYQARDRAGDLVTTEPYQGPESKPVHKGGENKTLKITHHPGGRTELLTAQELQLFYKSVPEEDPTYKAFVEHAAG